MMTCYHLLYAQLTGLSFLVTFSCYLHEVTHRNKR